MHCFDCRVQDNSCICIECFLAGDHSGHKFYFKLSKNAVCDCGDPDGWRAKGNCHKHRGLLNSVAGVAPHLQKSFSKQLIQQLFGLIYQAYISKDGEEMLQEKDTKEKLFSFLEGLIYTCKDNNDFTILVSESFKRELNKCEFLDRAKVVQVKEHFKSIYEIKSDVLRKNINFLKAHKNKLLSKPSTPRGSSKQTGKTKMQKFKDMFVFKRQKSTQKKSKGTKNSSANLPKNVQTLKKQMDKLVGLYEKRLPILSISLLDLVICVIKKRENLNCPDSFMSLVSVFKNSSGPNNFSNVIQQLFLKCFLNLEFKSQLANSLIKAKQFKNLMMQSIEVQLFNCNSVMKPVLGMRSLSFQAMHSLARDFNLKANTVNNLTSLKEAFKDFLGILKILTGSVRYNSQAFEGFIKSGEFENFVWYSMYFECLFNMDFDVMNANVLYQDNYEVFCKKWDLLVFHVLACINSNSSLNSGREDQLGIFARILLKASYFIEKIRHEQVSAISKQRKATSDPYLNLRFNNLLRFLTVILFNLFEVRVRSPNSIDLWRSGDFDVKQNLWAKVCQDFGSKELKMFFKFVSNNVIFYIKRLSKLHKKYDDLLMIETHFEYDKYLILLVQMLFNLDQSFQEIFQAELDKQLKMLINSDETNESLCRFYEKTCFVLHEIFYSPAVAQFFFLPFSLDFHKNDLGELTRAAFENINEHVPLVEAMIAFFVKIHGMFRFDEVKELVKVPFQSIMGRPLTHFLEVLLDRFCSFDLKNNRFVKKEKLFEGKKVAIANCFDLSYMDQGLLDALNQRNRALIYNKTTYFPENLFYLRENSLLRLNEYIREFATQSVDQGQVWVNTDEVTLHSLQEKSQYHLKLYIDLYNLLLKRNLSTVTPKKSKFKSLFKSTLKLTPKGKKSPKKTLKVESKSKPSPEELKKRGELMRLAKFILVLGNICRNHSLQISSLFYFAQKIRPVLPESMLSLCQVILGENPQTKELESSTAADKGGKAKAKSKKSSRMAKLMRKITKKKNKNYIATKKIVEEKTGIKIEEGVPDTLQRKNSNTADVCISCQNGFEKDEDVFFLMRLHKYDAHKLILLQNHWQSKHELVGRKRKSQKGILARLWTKLKINIPTTCNHPYHLKCIEKTLQNKKPVCLLCGMKSHVYINRKLLTTPEIRSKDAPNEPREADQLEDSSLNSHFSRELTEINLRELGQQVEGNNLVNPKMLQLIQSLSKAKSGRDLPNQKVRVFERIFFNLFKKTSISKKTEVDLENKNFGVVLYQKLMMPVEMLAKMVQIWCPENFLRKIFPCLSQYFFVLFSLKNLNECAFMEFSMVCNDVSEALDTFLHSFKNRELGFYTEMISKELALSSMEVLYMKLFLAKFWISVSALSEINCVKKDLSLTFEEINREILAKIVLVKVFQMEEGDHARMLINSETVISSCTNLLKLVLILEHMIFQKNLGVDQLNCPNRLNGSPPV